jgi:glutamine phosphoribosylpyrophosphate amidotransferase
MKQFGLMDARINLFDKSYWENSSHVFVQGGGFLDEEYYDAEELVQILENSDQKKVQSIISRLSGFFSVICDYEDSLVVAVDRNRTHPIFYTNIGNII